jgi:hypothetical protein
VNILLLASHAVAEYDDVRMFTDLGYDVFAPGGYEVPGTEGEGIRPTLPNAPAHPDLVSRLQEVRAKHGDPGHLIDAGKALLHDDIIDWADVIIVHHFPVPWIGGQWDRIRHKRVIWRTCGQSDRQLERFMAEFKALQIVRYSPKEQIAFGRDFAGQHALIRFGKYPDDYGPWIGDSVVVGNVTQHMKQRGDACGYGFWQAATAGLPVAPAGPGSEEIGGLGTLAYPEMLDYLRHLRAYLYTGTTPASYTLGLIEAMLSGVPIVSIGPDAWRGPENLFEGHEIAGTGHNHPVPARDQIAWILSHPRDAAVESIAIRQRAIDLFDVATIGPQWTEFLR